MPAGVSAITPLANITLSSTASTVTFSSISGAYRDLYLVVVAKTNQAGWQTRMRLNGDTGSNYNTIYLTNSSNTAFSQSSFGTTQMEFGPLGIASTTVDMIWKTNILDYSATDKHKNVQSIIGNIDSSMIDGSSHRYLSTSAITSLVVYPGSGTWSVGSNFALYGVSS
jgi:hypothetical protein